MLLVAFDKADEESFADIGFSVAVSVLGIEDFRGCTDDYSFAPRDDAVRKIEAVQEDG